jgi:hypothetical protein
VVESRSTTDNVLIDRIEKLVQGMPILGRQRVNESQADSDSIVALAAGLACQ